MVTQRERQSETRTRLLSAARQVFAENGYPRATVAEIVKRAGRSQGTFYLHFPDKESVLRALLEDAMARSSLRQDNERGSRLRDIVRRFVAEFGEDRDLWLLLDQRSSLEPAFKTMSDRWFQHLADNILDAIVAADPPGMRSVLDPVVLSRVFAAMLSDSTRAAYQERYSWSTAQMADGLSVIWARTLGLTE